MLAFNGAVSVRHVPCVKLTSRRCLRRLRVGMTREKVRNCTLAIKMLRHCLQVFLIVTSGRSGELSARVASDTEVIQKAIGDKVGRGIQICATLVCSLTLGFYSDWRLALLLLGTLATVTLL